MSSGTKSCDNCWGIITSPSLKAMLQSIRMNFFNSGILNIVPLTRDSKEVGCSISVFDGGEAVSSISSITICAGLGAGALIGAGVVSSSINTLLEDLLVPAGVQERSLMGTSI